jgi:hypothetical protein
MDVTTNISGYEVRVCYTDTKMWQAFVVSPGAKTPHPIVIRASAEEGKEVLLERLKAFLHGLHANSRTAGAHPAEP